MVPSPHDTFRLLTVPSGSAAVMVRVIVVPVVPLVVDSVKLTVGARSLMVLLAVALLSVVASLYVAFTYTVKSCDSALPVLAYAWLSVALTLGAAVTVNVSTVPSPQDTLSPVTLMLLEPEPALIVSVIDCPVVAVVVDFVKVTLFTAPPTLGAVAGFVVQPLFSVAFT